MRILSFSCGALGVRLWCKQCISDHKALVPALFDYYRERRLQSQLNNKCRQCLGMSGILAILI